MWQIAISGFILGLISSLHCVGMCGPLMLALPVRHLGKIQQLAAIITYNTGRIFTYSFIGLLVGFAGRRIYLAGLQQWVSVLLGIVMLLLALLYYFRKKSLQPSWMMKWHIRVQETVSHLLQTKNFAGYFLLGSANGLLPCGMVYIAMTAAFVTTGAGHSVLFMALFGAGTLPAMLVFGYFGIRFTASVRHYLRSAMPVFVVAVALLLILRGMNLGIPFISPALAEAPGQVVPCHH